LLHHRHRVDKPPQLLAKVSIREALTGGQARQLEQAELTAVAAREAVRRQETVFVSRDGGRSFDRPTEVEGTPLYVSTEMPVVLSDGSVVVSFLELAKSEPDLANRRGYVIRSSDGASTFAKPSLVMRPLVSL
jgi:hypothetical protein